MIGGGRAIDFNGVRKAEKKDSYGTFRSFVQNAASITGLEYC